MTAGHIARYSIKRTRWAIAAAALTLLAMPAAAQEVQGPPDGFLEPTRTPAPAPRPAQGPDNGGIPPLPTPQTRPQPGPSQPAPVITVPAEPAPQRSAPPVAGVRQRADAPATPRPAAAAATPPAPASDALEPPPLVQSPPVPLAEEDIGAAADTAPTTSLAPPNDDGTPLLPVWWPWALALAVAFAGAWWWLRRDRPTAAFAEGDGDAASDASAPAPPAPARPTTPTPLARAAPTPPAPATPPAAAPAPTAPVAVSGRARLVMTLKIDAIEMLADQARIRFSLLLANQGDRAATGGLVRIALQQASRRQSELLERFFDGAGGSVLAEDVEIAAGDVGTIQRNALLPLADVEPMLVAGYPSLIPVIGFDVTYHWDGEGDAFGQVAAAYVLGSLTAADGKIAPVRLDLPPRRLASPSARVTEMQRIV